MLMMYPFLTMNDHAEIVYSHLLDDGRVKIYVEKPDEQDGFHHAVQHVSAPGWRTGCTDHPRSVPPCRFLRDGSSPRCIR